LDNISQNDVLVEPNLVAFLPPLFVLLFIGKLGQAFYGSWPTHLRSSANQTAFKTMAPLSGTYVRKRLGSIANQPIIYSIACRLNEYEHIDRVKGQYIMAILED
jgi:hypothetical protein